MSPANRSWSSFDFERFHVRTMKAGGVHLTETEHPPGFALPTHHHETVSLYLVLAGQFSEQFGQRSTERRAGQLIFTPAYEPHSDAFAGCSSRCFIIELEVAMVARVLECGNLPLSPKCFYGPGALQAGRLYREFCLADPFAALTIESVAFEMLAEVCRESSPSRSAGPSGKTEQAREFLHANFSKSVSLRETAEAVDVHPVYLARMFRQRFGCSVGEYLRRHRIEIACFQISTTQKPLAEIACDCGFADQSHFSRTFLQLMGVTPSRYRAAS